VLRTTKALLLALVAVTFFAAGCGTSSGSSPTAPAKVSSTATVAYRNAPYGFSLRHAALLTQGPATTGSQASSGPAFTIAFADTKGTTVGGSYEDGVKISVGTMASAIPAAELPALKSQFAASLHGLLASLTAAKVVQPLHLVHVNGVSGYSIIYTFTEGSTAFHAVTDILLKGKREYQVTGQASTQRWPAIGPQIEATLASFRAI